MCTEEWVCATYPQNPGLGSAHKTDQRVKTSSQDSWGGMNLLRFLFVNDSEGTGNLFLMFKSTEEYSL